ncbi:MULTISPECIES: hypothetical protein [Streptomyces]|uniref:Uncharacterized protein n=1 Tax=Streptomyces venezuelae (strain ATCC 10712 / CBS 650.69 / DSM 40230 / JCM 4526 / NBRC 13096 / PD 04745) TaxID=953739 RepID=F2R1X8_STRVP|nr:hypothetical protein [Streptomyces venezuelae]APE25942.1 hypothetical protein vnz_36275 [Streptomyces venezuelae]QES03278.1 hypothetical protein DEJ43_36850 [Streptomyces venezuelae ATCC 10712]CCA60645.1 hypothetical protein SVEN_7359 [Streptomyces venezuelae ATCC 10712]
MRGYAGVLIGNLVLAALAGLAGPVFLVGAYVAWTEGAEWFLVAAAGGIGAVGTALIPVAAVRSARQSFPRITRRDHVTVDWARTNLLAGVTTAEVVTHDGHRVPLPRRSEALWPLMNLLVAHGLSNPKPVLDLRRPRMGAVSAMVLGIIRDAEPDVAGAGR